MEAEVITSFLPDLVKAVSGCVQSVSDQCLAKGLIPESVYKRVLEIGVHTSEDKARTLLQAVKNSTETDERCFELFLKILEQELPFYSRDRLLNDIRKEANEKANQCTAVVPSSQSLQQISRGELSKECEIYQKILLQKLEEAIRKHQSACEEKKHSEERLKVKTEECEELKHALENQTQKASTDFYDTKSKISACESEIEILKARVKEIESVIEEQDMQARRGRNDTIIKTWKMLATIFEESRAKEETRDREHKLKMQEKDIEIQKLKEESKRQKESSDATNFVPEDALTPTHVAHMKKYFISSGVDQNEDTQRQKNLALHLGFTEEEYKKLETLMFTRQLFAEAATAFDTDSYMNVYDDDEESEEPVISNNLHNIIAHWVNRYPGDSRGTTSYPTYSYLLRALFDQGFGEVVRELPRDINGLSEGQHP